MARKIKKLSRELYFQNLHHFIPEIDFIIEPVLCNKEMLIRYLKIVRDGVGYIKDLKNSYARDVNSIKLLIKKMRKVVKENVFEILEIDGIEKYVDRDSLETFRKNHEELYSLLEQIDIYTSVLDSTNSEYNILKKKEIELKERIKKIND